MKSRGAVAVALLTILVAVAPAHAASTRAEYIAQADPICQSTEAAERQAIGPKGNIQRLLKQGRYKAAARRFRNEFAAFAPGVEQIAALEPPAADAQLLGAWVGMLRAQVPLGKQAAAAMARGRTRGKLFARLGSINVKTRALVATFGFQYCQNL